MSLAGVPPHHAIAGRTRETIAWPMSGRENGNEDVVSAPIERDELCRIPKGFDGEPTAIVFGEALRCRLVTIGVRFAGDYPHAAGALGGGQELGLSTGQVEAPDVG